MQSPLTFSLCSDRREDALAPRASGAVKRDVRTTWLALSFIGATSLGLGGCITSPSWEYGATAEAKKAELGPCPDGLLEDGEDGDNQIRKVGGRDGYWFTFVDTWGTMVEPKGDFKMSEGGPPGSKYAARARGKVAKAGESLYVGLGFNFTNPKTPFDVSQAKGIRFWAKGPARFASRPPT